jgi:hypothetical protein
MKSPPQSFVRLALALAPATLSLPQARAQTVPLPQQHAEATAQGSSEDAEIRRLYREANKLALDGKLHEARTRLLRAFAIRRTYDVATALGQVELAMQLPRDAAEHFEFALRNFPPQPSEDILNQVRRDFARARELVGALHVTVDSPGAELSVDGKRVGVAPLEAPLFLVPGAHTIVAEQGSRRVASTVRAEPGGVQRLDLAIGKPQPSDPGQAPAARSRLEPALLITGGAIVLAGVGVGVGYAVAAEGSSDRAKSLQRGLPSSSCSLSGSHASRCRELRKELEDFDRNRNISTVAFAVAGAALVGTAAYWFLAQDDEPQRGSAKALRFAATATHREASLWLSGDL